MNLDIFKLPDPSGRYSKESFLIKNFKEEYDFIINYCICHNLLDIPFKEKAYLCVNNIKSYPRCKNPNCNKKVNYKNSTIGFNEYCSNKCVSSDPNIKKIKEEKSLEKFGTKAPAQSLIVKQKQIETNQKRYGGNSAMSSIEIQKKSKKTLMENYGVDNPVKSSVLLDKRVESFMENVDQWKESYKNTSLDKYGVEHPWMDTEIHNKSVIKAKKVKNEKFLTIISQRIPTNHKILEVDFDAFKRNIKVECNRGHIYEINRELLYLRNLSKTEICTVCNPPYKGISGKEIQLLNFIKDNYNGEIIENSRKIISPYEVDIYLPDLKVGFEFNGLYWHSDEFREKDYHFKKHQIAEKNNIRLISIWEDDWDMKNNIVKSSILNKIMKTTNKIFARNCEIKNVESSESEKFLIENHLQGNVKSSIRIGLFYKNELVSLMMFSQLRSALNRNLKSDPLKIELTRFCSKNYISVIGGASKLFQYFINNYSFNKIETYSDNMISEGNLYNKLGFKYSHTSLPGYYYLIDGVREHRYNWRKHVLVDMGFDENKTEEEIMSEMGYFRLYNAGNKKWTFEN